MGADRRILRGIERRWEAGLVTVDVCECPRESGGTGGACPHCGRYTQYERASQIGERHIDRCHRATLPERHGSDTTTAYHLEVQRLRGLRQK